MNALTSVCNRFTLTIAVCLLAASIDSVPATAQSTPTPSGFSALFNGVDLSGWHGDDPHVTARAAAEERTAAIEAQQAAFREHWKAVDGALFNDGHGPYATTDQEFGDIELLVDYKTVALADSGIYLRGTPQIQIWDWTEAGGKWDRHADRGSGGLFNNRAQMPGQLPLVRADRPFGEWNHFHLLQIGARTWVELNHKLVVDGAIMENYWDKDRVKPLPARGPIHLQTHGGEISWRSILVREIDADEAITRLRSDDSKYGFQSLFNGSDLSGWSGAVADYEVIDGALVCKPGKGGVLYTEEQFDDFVVRVEFKLPAGGNNGLAIRYPGSGQASYDGMCELQVLDDEHPKYASLDARQYHGSVYGVAAAQRGYLRPAGQWNYQEVSVIGSRIKVELNGNVIVDADVSQITEFKDDRAHPGLRRTRGHFGFAGHNDPVMFRNIAIKRIGSTPAKANEELPTPIFHASFDGQFDAQVFRVDGRVYTADSPERKNAVVGQLPESVSIAEGAGVRGDCLRFAERTERILFFAGSETGYRSENWSGSLSVWMKLDPDQDLAPGYCDPIQMTERGWNDGSFFVDFDKDLPRDFRLGVFPDFKTWNPENIDWDAIPVDKRPMVVVKKPPFRSSEWTHVCYTWQNVNASDGGDARATLYLNGEEQGSMQQPLRFTWDPEKAALMFGIYYTGLLDELEVYGQCLTPEQVKETFRSMKSN